MRLPTVLFFFFSVCLSRGFIPEKYSGCQEKDFGHGSIVCVCSEQECGEFESGGSPLKAGQFAVYTSTKAGERFKLSLHLFNASFTRPDDDAVSLDVNSSVSYQEILGFGGAFTDAATMNILNQSNSLQQKLIRSYFSPVGIEYSIGRVPMASCDFSTHEYSYDDYSGDFELKNFSLAEEDKRFKIPVILSAMKDSNKEILLFGSPWSAPGWMKTNGRMSGAGTMLGKAGDKYHKTWAIYFAKFISAYVASGVPIWGVTVQNEPSTGFIPGYSFQTMAYSPQQERDFIKEDLGPALSQEGHGNVQIIMLDDQRLFLDNWVDVILGDPEAAKFVSGIGLHWYWDFLASVKDLTIAHQKYPNYFMLATEACSGFTTMHPPMGVVLGSWERGENYTHSIIQDISHWVVGWVDWNLALNMSGGPNWVNNNVDSPVIVDTTHHVFYQQPMYFHLGHFSKFVPRGSKRISLMSSKKTNLQFIGFQAPGPDSTTVVVIMNQSEIDIPLHINVPGKGSVNTIIPARAVQTYVWNT
ncbi:predicted protein [Nematostella vectensis]|uniref:Glucosylceramidase n=1 Tax=Nematostella vectensis TaxID=45351 RepID=A7SBY2_NEMVE|nr:predicted protein [Nematostella vectensis]|eukprot:XP_001630873.1 predicted protein [Nematostella vectensis]